MVTASGSTTWTLAVKGNPYSLAFADQKLYISTDSGYIYCFGSDSTSPANVVQPSMEPFTFVGSTSGQQYAAAAETIISLSGVTQGYALVIDENGFGGLAYSIAAASDMSVVCIVADSAKAENLKIRLDKADAYGKIYCYSNGSK